MLENLVNLVKELGQDQVVNNPEVPNDQNNAVLAEATHAVAGGLQNALANGQGEDVLKLFQSQGADVTSNPVAQNIQGSFLDNITSKLGISKNVAMGLAASFLPMIISKLVHKTNDSNDNSFDIGGIIGSLTGGGGNNAGGGGIASLISQFAGGGGNAGGGGIASLISQFAGGAQQQQAQQGGGGLMDVIKGLL